MIHSLLSIYLSLSSVILFSQTIQTENILILRDDYGVPYIYSQTDAEAAYALAWVQCEDNFYDVQESFLAGKGLLSSVSGKEGALLDAFSFIVNAEAVVNEQYENGLSADFKLLIEAYAQGINRYGEMHPEEIRHPALFPLNSKDILKTYILNMTLISNVHFDLGRIFDNNMTAIIGDQIPSGSNGIALSPNKTKDGKTYLLSNSHQPLEGFAAWYEVQINTQEGWHFHGATFAAGVVPVVGTNLNLGWTHTINYNDYDDVYKLEMHPTKKNLYKFDGEWLPLTKRKLKLKVKIAGIPLPVSRTFYESKQGAVIKNKSGYYAIRFPANMVIGAPEQWYRMNKAQNYEEFTAALAMQKIVSLNFIYADREGTIMYLDNGLFPYRDSAYDWSKVLPGNTSKTLWEPNFRPLSDLNLVKNPPSGYVFNMNNSGFDCTGPKDNPDPLLFNPAIGYQLDATARSIRFQELMAKENLMSYEDLKRVKYDSHMSFPMCTRGIQNLDIIRHLDAHQYPEIAAVIERLKEWDGSVLAENRQAAIISLAVQQLTKYMVAEHIIELNKALPEEEYVKALQFAKEHLLKHFGTIDIALGDLQKHVRGDVELPIWGIPEAITQMYTVPYKKGMYRSVLGESFILFATYNEDGLEKIETINCFGSSANEGSPHYTDQMQMFVNKELRQVSMNKDENLKKAKQAYRPD